MKLLPLDPQVLADRAQRIGSSDVPAILGYNPASWEHEAIDVWNEKVLGVRPPPKQTGPLYWGTKHEPIIREAYREQQIERGCPHDLLIVPGGTYYGREWEVAHLDAELPGTPRGIVEIKTGNGWADHEWGKEGTDEIPQGYMAQVQWQLMLTGYAYAEVAVLIAGSIFRVYRVEPHAELQQMIRDRVARFWFEHVLKRVPPEPSPGAESRLWPESKRASVVLSLEAMAALRRRAKLKAAMKKMETLIERDEHVVKMELGAADEGICPETNLGIVDWTTHEQRRVDTKRVRALHPAVALECQVTTPVRTFRTTKRFKVQGMDTEEDGK